MSEYCPKCGEKTSEDDSRLCANCQAPSELAAPAGSEAAWKTLAIRMADEAQACLDNAHWEVKVGSGDLLATIKAIRLLQAVELRKPQNDQALRPE